ncbi:MAG: signal peptide peptidase SppA [Nanoarchaeota archaeon]
MKKREECRSRWKSILLTAAAVFFVFFFAIPLLISIFSDDKLGNVALIPIEGEITADGGQEMGLAAVSAKEIVNFVEEADENPEIKVILLEINSPGGSAVASDEIADAVSTASKPVVALIREAGASGAYWVASAADYVIANRMSITGSIGVLSSYLEFSGLMEKYGVNYEELTAGQYKELGSPYKTLSSQDRLILQSKLNKIHGYFIEKVAENRKLDIENVKALATGEFFLGVEALDLGLVDQLGNKDTAEEFIKGTYGLKKISYVNYEHETGFFDILGSVFSDFSFKMGEGIGSILLKQQARVWL